MLILLSANFDVQHLKMIIYVAILTCVMYGQRNHSFVHRSCFYVPTSVPDQGSARIPLFFQDADPLKNYRMQIRGVKGKNALFKVFILFFR